MSEQPHKRRTSPFIVWPVCVFLVVVLYLGSYGPVVSLYVQERISEETMTFLNGTVYFPITWVIHSGFFTRYSIGQPYVRYLNWWMRVGQAP